LNTHSIQNTTSDNYITNKPYYFTISCILISYRGVLGFWGFGVLGLGFRV
jgi:hypothetical protein